MSKVIGIDLGTSNSAVAFINSENQAEIIYDKAGNDTVPSIFAINANDEPVIGYDAKAQHSTNRKNTIFAVKRLIGRKITIEVNGIPMSPEEVSSQVLVRMKEVAEESLGEEVKRAVITVPAHFNDSERQATRDAGRLAGLDVLRLINEPTAAALAFGEKANADRMIVVFDLGGGTFDISILELRDGVFDVKSTNGDTYLGGEDFDMAVVGYFLEEFKKRTGRDVSK
ncbi:UNVERIFIED_CONTAM: hypothetical protein GTU68_019150, partial [Idotea baltica]|nr:hypothetical protein [Idotea baltica]